MEKFQSVNPYSRELIASYSALDSEELVRVIERASTGFDTWRKMSLDERGVIIFNVGKILLSNKQQYAHLITAEMGKVLPEAVAEIEKCAWACSFYAENAAQFLADERIEAGFSKSYIGYEPVGAILAIMPWNFPFWQVFRYAIPTLMGGNVTILKHAPNVFGCALTIARIFEEAGAPQGVVQAVVAGTDIVETLLTTTIVQGVTLTGSERAGIAVATAAAKNVKKSVLELGGSDAMLVLEDADLERAATIGLQSRLLNAGQSCIGPKRMIVAEKVKADFLQLLINGLKNFRQGDPLEAGITTGPLARLDLAENLHRQLKSTLLEGASLESGGQVDGCNVEPSLLSGVAPGMTAFEEETFGPLLSVIAVKDENAALQLANQTRYGLAASIWTRDPDRGERLARQISSGAVFINSLVKSVPQLPFGGIKKSGYGRELGRHGMLEFLNAKTIVVE